MHVYTTHYPTRAFLWLKSIIAISSTQWYTNSKVVSIAVAICSQICSVPCVYYTCYSLRGAFTSITEPHIDAGNWMLWLDNVIYRARVSTVLYMTHKLSCNIKPTNILMALHNLNMSPICVILSVGVTPNASQIINIPGNMIVLGCWIGVLWFNYDLSPPRHISPPSYVGFFHNHNCLYSKNEIRHDITHYPNWLMALHVREMVRILLNFTRNSIRQSRSHHKYHAYYRQRYEVLWID